MVKDRHQKDNTNCHLILAARTAKGIGDLNEALSEANLTGYYYRPRVDMELLLSLDPSDVFLTTACIAGVFKYGLEEAERLILQLYAHFRASFMLEVQPHHTDKQRALNAFLLKLYRRHGIPLIAGMDSHFILPEQAALRDHRLEANHIQYEEEEGWFLDYPDEAEAIRRFQAQGILPDALIREALQHTNVFLDFEDVALDRSRKLPTLYPGLTQEQRNQKYRDLVHAEWTRYAQGMPEAERAARAAGIAYEVDTITSTNMSDYFLLDYEIVRRAKAMGGVITPTGRGSAVSYLTNMLLGFSSVDRFAIPVEMFPDRFISADRILSGSTPDIDLNLANEEVFQQAQAEVLGEWRSAPMVAFGTLRRLSAWKMFCRAQDIPYDTAQAVGECLRRYERDVKYAEDDADIELDDYVPEAYRELVQTSEQYMGIIDSISPHPCAYLLCCADIRREIGIIRINGKGSKKKVVYAAFIDGATAEAYGYLKNDLLHVDVVKINQEAFDRAGMPLPAVGELLRRTQNDPETWRMYADGLTMGLNQVEREQTRLKAMQYKPRNITELAAFVAAVRPAFKSMLPVFLDRQHFDYGIPVFDQLIQTREMTSSLLLYQEQVMKVLQYAGFAAPESYATIKAISKKHPEKVLPLKERFLSGFADKITEGDTPCVLEQAASMAARVWTIIDDATSYGFNSSHAVCVALDSLYGAWLKAHHPLEYYCTLLHNYALKGDKNRSALVKEEMRRGFGIRVTPCRFRQDNRDFYLDKEHNAISDALTSVKHISRRVADALYDLRHRQYGGIIDLLYELEMHPAFDATSIRVLLHMGYFAEFGFTGKLLQVYRAFREGEHRFSKAHVPATQQKRLEALRQLAAALPEEAVPPAQQVAFELEHFGTVLSTFPSHGQYAVLELDTRYSPKLRLYNLATGATGLMKMRKDLFKRQPVQPGQLLHITGWERRPAYQFIDGKPKRKAGVTELWIRSYVQVAG